nr:MAG TPA: hypothetical protein [Caudoviricetes sp.]
MDCIYRLDCTSSMESVLQQEEVSRLLQQNDSLMVGAKPRF